MARHVAWVFVAALLWAVPASATPLECDHEQQAGVKQTPAKAPDGHAKPEERRWMWWRVAETRAELGISDPQSKEIDQIFQATVPALRSAKDELDKLDQAVALTIKEGTADVGAVLRQVQQAEQARATLTTTRTVMFYRMHRVLRPDQRMKLNAMLERLDAERRKNDRNDPRGRR
jgi:Spy/CpxP family protein refolding chaperone